MSKLIYITNASLDGYVADATGGFDWINPDQVHAFITEWLRPIDASGSTPRKSCSPER